MMRGSKLLGWAAKLLKPLADYSRATAPVLAWFRGESRRAVAGVPRPSEMRWRHSETSSRQRMVTHRLLLDPALGGT